MYFVISGPSGCGKTTLVRRALKKLDGVEFSVSHTTRKKRPSEQEGRDYYFVSREEFEMRVREAKFIEWAEVHRDYYGTSKREVEKKGAASDVILDLDVQGAKQVKESLKKATFIFVFPPHFNELKRRLEERGENSPEEITRRIEVARREVREYPEFDYLVINGSLDEAVKDLVSIIAAERSRREVKLKDVLPILRSFFEER